MAALPSLLFLYLVFPLISCKNTCPTLSCNKTNFNVKFPFGIKNRHPKNCTYPDFELGCTKQGLTSLNLSNSGEFLVRHINYPTQEIVVYDQNNCLAKRIQHLDLSNSPFISLYYVEIIFLTCPAKLVKSNYTVIECLSDEKQTILATTRLDLAIDTRACDIIDTYMVPVSRTGPYDDHIVTYIFKNDIILTWDVPSCTQCEAFGTKCGFVANSTYKVVCFYDHELGTAGKRNGNQIFRIVSLAITVPAIACIFVFALFARFIINRQLSVRRVTITRQTTPEPTITIVTGLDESTIESYAKVTLGESKRLPGPGDGTCAICLSEFCANEMIRVIPECKHCFHATCIDEWLRMRSTCPVCRNSPLPLPSHQNVDRS